MEKSFTTCLAPKCLLRSCTSMTRSPSVGKCCAPSGECRAPWGGRSAPLGGGCATPDRVAVIAPLRSLRLSRSLRRGLAERDVHRLAGPQACAVRGRGPRLDHEHQLGARVLAVD